MGVSTSLCMDARSPQVQTQTVVMYFFFFSFLLEFPVILILRYFFSFLLTSLYLPGELRVSLKLEVVVVVVGKMHITL